MLHAALDASGCVHLHSCYNAPVNLIHVPSNDPEYHIIAQKFWDGWNHPHKSKPTVKNIFYVAYSSSEALEHLGKFSDYSNKVGNTEMLFHGTQRACRIAESPNDVKSCSLYNCNLCSILKGSYNMERAKGKRINVNTTLRNRVMIVNHVALGRSKTMYEASHGMQHAPHMYNSVTAATYPEGGKVNYHEAVVYREDAICANAVVVFA
ncbi:hypothetical protein BDZ97DRAFT_235246 [Flammula alnicola]|nr:hypothetical protein BDZ97DRAFT_235246 [Flammula alnicola]